MSPPGGSVREEGEGHKRSPPLPGGQLRRFPDELSHLVYEAITFGALLRECEAQGVSVPAYSTETIEKQIGHVLMALDEDERWQDDVDSVYDAVLEALAEAQADSHRAVQPTAARRSG